MPHFDGQFSDDELAKMIELVRAVRDPFGYCGPVTVAEQNAYIAGKRSRDAEVAELRGALEYTDNCLWQVGIDPDQPPRMRVRAALSATEQREGT